MAGRFIKLFDKMVKWEWFTHADTLQLFIYLLLKANYKDATFQGVKVKRGQIMTSLSKLGQATGQSIRMVRDNLNHLEMTGEVTSQSTNRYRIITIVRYDDYQSIDKQNDKQMTSNLTSQPTSNLTNKTATSIEYIEDIERNRNIEPPKGGRSASRFQPPTKEEVFDFCMENGLGVDVDRFYDYYTSNGWKVGKNPMKDWQATVRNWARKNPEFTVAMGNQQPKPARKVSAQQYSQRDYTNEQMDAMLRMIDGGA